MQVVGTHDEPAQTPPVLQTSGEALATEPDVLLLYDVTRGVDQALDEMRPGLPGIQMDNHIFRPAEFIEISISNLTDALLLGTLLVVCVLVAFLFEWRAAVISLAAIPLSLMAAAMVEICKPARR